MDVLPARISQYEIRRVLGKGGMGIVYLAFDPALHRQVALKVLRTDSDDQRERFRREARTVARLQHPNIVAIYAVGEHDEQPFIAMEYIDGEPLSEGIRRRAPWGLQRKLMMGADLCAGLAFAHRAGVIHRDVKPSNLIVANGSGAVRLLDFGIARGADPAGTLGLTMHGNIIGTLNYMSPEQITGQAIDHRSDVFAVGLVLYELVTYRQAFAGDNLATLTYRIVHGSPDPIRSIEPDADEALCAVIERAMARRPDDRYPHLDAMRSDLLRIAATLTPANAARLAPAAATDADGASSVHPPIWSHALDVTAPASGPVTPRSTARVPNNQSPFTVETTPSTARPWWPALLMLGGLVVGGAGAWLALRPDAAPPATKVEQPSGRPQTPSGSEGPDIDRPHITKELELAKAPDPSGADPASAAAAPAASDPAASSSAAGRAPGPGGIARRVDRPSPIPDGTGAAPVGGVHSVSAAPPAASSAGPTRPDDTAPPPVPVPTTLPRDAAAAGAETRVVIPPVATAPAPGPSDDEQVRAVLNRWARAYAARDARGVDEVQPGTASTLERQFADLRSVQVSLSACRVSVEGSAASAECGEQFAAQTKFGGASDVSRQRHFSLQKAGGEWRITGTRVR